LLTSDARIPLATGVMIAFFYSAGIFPTDIELLNSIEKGSAKCDANF